MPALDLAELNHLVEGLRAAGVSAYEGPCGDVSVKLIVGAKPVVADVPVVAPAPTKPLSPDDEIDRKLFGRGAFKHVSTVAGS